MENSELNNNKIINYFNDKIIIYALVAAIIVTYFYLDYKRYTDFGPILNELVELLITPLFWVIYKLKTKKTFLYNYKEIFKFSITYSVILTFISMILNFIMFNQNSKPLHRVEDYFSLLIAIGIRTIIIYIWITFINVVCGLIVNIIKFILKKRNSGRNGK